MDWTAPQRNILFENEYKNPKIKDYEIDEAIKLARGLDGWDVFATSLEQNKKLLGEKVRTVAARFWTKDQAKKWLLMIDPDDRQLQKWFDERFEMPCYLATATYQYLE